MCRNKGMCNFEAIHILKCPIWSYESDIFQFWFQVHYATSKMMIDMLEYRVNAIHDISLSFQAYFVIWLHLRVSNDQ